MKTWLKLTVIEMKLFIREPINVVFTFALPLIFLFVMGGVFGNTPNAEIYRGVGAMNYYVPAYFALILTTIGVVSLPIHLAGYRERGVLKRLHASEIPAIAIFGSQLITSFIIALIGSLLVWGLARVTHPDLAWPKELGLAFAAFVLGAFCFAAIGFLLGALLPSTRSAQGLGLILFFVMMILGGAGPPPEVLTGSMRIISDATPIKYVIGLIQDPWLGLGWNAGYSLIVAGITLAASLLAMRLFRWE
jgi:ABC-2 type transport system permease protein